YVNGQYTKIKGVNNHQDHAGVGTAMPDYLQYYRVRLLKQMGANAWRTSHNPPDPGLLDACDSLGLLVLDENRLLNSSPEYMDQFRRLVMRDRNHASVFLWSIGNEEQRVQTNSIGKRIAETLMAAQMEWDPTRSCTYAADLPNVYRGVNEVIPIRGFNYRIAAVDPYHHDHPGQPILGTEMGSTVTTRGIYNRDTVNAYVPDEDLIAPWWANTAEQWWTLAADRPWWLGGFVWTGFDYRGEPTPYQWPNINSHFGVMDMCGFPKNLYYYYQSWWTDEDVLHISPHWNWKGKEGQPIPVWVNTNADDVELFLNGKSLGKKDMPRNRHLEWTVPYEAGTLEAVAFKKGKKLTAKVTTTGDPFEIVVTPYKTTMPGDGKDATVINISVVDRQGREVPDASNLIRFTAAGDLHMIGTGNGDPSSHEPDKCEEGAWQRHLFNGKCQVIVQAGTRAGMYKFEAKADGLQTGSTDINLVRLVEPQKVGREGAGVWTARPVSKMMGADISFLPELEDRGVKFSDNKGERDAIQILKDHGFNYIRLRIFKDPARDSGYSPKKGFCDLAHTLQMAKRVKAAGLQLLLDFHYSDYWADPGKQFKPASWVGEDFNGLRQSVYSYTKEVMDALKQQGTLPDMVQVGNEINHGMIWPEGGISHPDSLAELVYAGIRGVKAVDPACPIMLHIALGGQNDESHFFIDNMLERGVPFDVIGLSYYPKWHGTLTDLKYNVNDLARQYRKDVIVVEYTQLKREVNEIAFGVPGDWGKGTCIWEPLNTWERIFEKDGKANNLLYLYDDLSKEFVTNKKQ
ncbi:MAG TPA: glycosyl hydrolase 53 family protein, partial [Puia sp.]|nr:glycosyl hydrolase 53 family protein [Puia sp.]